MPTQQQPSSLFHKIFDLAQCILGIYVFFVIMSIYQEKIARHPYNGSYFNYPLFLVFLQCVINALTAYFKILLFKKPNTSNTTKNSEIPTSYFVYMSLAYVIAVISSNGALMYVNYPTQVLAKSCKMIPTMVMGVLVAKKHYPIHKYLTVLAITVGISVFMFDRASDKEKKFKKHEINSVDPMLIMYGYILLGVSLAMDGVTHAFQTKMREDFHTKPSGDDLMLYMNLYGAMFCGVAMMAMNQFFPAVQFCVQNHAVIWDVAIFCGSMALGQIFIFWCIAGYGPLVCTLITTTRKFFSILFSIFWYGHAMSGVSWIGVVLVFVGVLYDAIIAFFKHKHEHEQQAKQKQQETKQD